MPVIDYGSSADRHKFLSYLRDRKGCTLEDLAAKSGYGVDTVKGWFSKSEARRRPCADRAITALLNDMQISSTTYWSIVRP